MVDPQLDGIKEPTARLAVITQNLYSTCYERVTRGVLHQVCDIVFVESLYRKVFIGSNQDRLVFALLLARIHLRAAQGETPLDQEFKVISASTLIF